MSTPEENETPGHVFTRAEANELIPQLRSYFTVIRRAKTVLVQTSDDIKKASANAESGGGSRFGRVYIQALHDVSSNLQSIQDLGVVVKDVNAGLCDFPYSHEGRIVYLCWKLGETEIRWWHELSLGYKDRLPLEESAM
jgi:hypothetical protein